MIDAIFKNASADMLDKMAELNNRLINYDEETESIPRIEIDNEFHQLIYESPGKTSKFIISYFNFSYVSSFNDFSIKLQPFYI